MSESTSSSGLTGWLAANRNQGGLALMIAGIVLAAVPVWLASQYGTELLGIEIIFGLVAALFLFTGVVLRFRPEGSGSPIDEARVAVLTIGGVTGLCVAILGVMLNVQWWDFLTRWLRFGERDGAWKVLLALCTLVAGLAIMFLTLAGARTEERSSPVLRRLIYGYNAVLSGILLFLILVVINTLAFVKLPAMVDSTESGIFQLSDRSKQILRGLDQPTTVYLIMETDSIVFDEMKTLLANAQEFAPRLRVETMSTGLSASQIRDLAKQYPEITSDGVLIVYGEGKDGPSSFIKMEEIVKATSTGRGERTQTFEGEARLITELAFLSENKQKTVAYFASGNADEFDVNDSDPRNEAGVGTLKRRLELRNYDVRVLKFDVADPKVPDDAAMVVLPNPRQAYTQPMVAALQKYMTERKGKLVLLTSAHADRRASTMPETGLEALLAGFKVELTKDRILMLPVRLGSFAIRDPEMTVGLMTPSAVNAKNPIAVAFNRVPFVFDQSRIVRPSEPAGPNSGDPNLLADTLIQTGPGLEVWAERDMQASARQLAESLQQNPTLRKEKLSNNPLPFAVLVSESPQFGMGDTAAKPRLAVFGTANFITNPRVDEARGNPDFDLFAGTLDWLRERPSNIGIEPRLYKNYMLPPGQDAFRLVFLPGILALVAIVGLGAGVWVVRRR